MTKLKTKNLFLDTEVFRAGGFNYRSTAFETLASLAISGTVHVFVTDLTIKEVQALIRKRDGRSGQGPAVFRKEGLHTPKLQNPIGQDENGRIGR
jgi:hypothetical protein